VRRIISENIQANNVPGIVASRRSLLGEQALSLAKAARCLPSVRGKKTPHPSTLYRWATEGRKSRGGRIIRLEIVRVGGTNCTSMEALTRFFERLNDIEPVDPPRTLALAAQERQAEEAKKILRQRGLIQ
jgi:hypothetical protein